MKKKNAFMTDEQRKFILENRMKMYTDEISAQINVTEGAIISLLYRLGLPRLTYSKYERSRNVTEKPEPQQVDRSAFTTYSNRQFV